jgi:hypothetical protein
LKTEIELFLEMNGKSCLWLCDDCWVCGFLFCIDITGYISKMNDNLQEANHLVIEIIQEEGSFV